MTDATLDKGQTDTGPNPDVYDELPDAPPKKRLRLSWVGKISVAIVAFWVFMAFFGQFIAPYDEAFFIEEDPNGEFFLDPTFMMANFEIASYMGTDYIGRDVMSRIMWGARTTIGISFAATLLAYFLGITLGIAAAVAGGMTDTILSRGVDAILAFPNIMLGLIVIAAFSGQSYFGSPTDQIILLVLLAGFVYAASVFRIARALGQDIMVQDYVEAARARGEGLWWIISREVLPNAAMPLATDFGLRLVFVILFISSLSFLGLGVPPPMADWGSMVRENLAGLANGFFIDEANGDFAAGALASVAPALAIASLTIAINLIVDDISAQAGGSLAKKMV
ncbi:MAG: ABC transporter permease [Pseudomonadota bacterium]